MREIPFSRILGFRSSQAYVRWVPKLCFTAIKLSFFRNAKLQLGIKERRAKLELGVPSRTDFTR